MTTTPRVPVLLLAAAFFVAGIAAAIDSAAAVVFRLNPVLAERLALNPGEALAAQADRALAISVEQKRSDSRAIVNLAREALQHSPILPNALRDIGFVVAAKDAEQGRRLMLAAVAQSRRETFALLWLIEDGARHNRPADALRWFDFALRTKSETRQLLFPTLAKALADPAFRGEFVSIARRNPEWLAPFYQMAIDQPGGAETIARTLIATGRFPDRPEFRLIEAGLLKNLVAQQEFELAREAYPLTHDHNQQLPISAALNAVSVDPAQGGMGWQIDESGVATSSGFVTIDRKPSLSVVAFAGRRGLAASKLLFLAPGFYRLAFSLAPGTNATTEPVWEIVCAHSQGSLPIGGTGRNRTIEIPSACPAQMLRLLAAGAETGDGEFTVQSIELRSVGAEDR